MPVSTLVFTDLDGTLLDHDNYSHADAAKSLDLLRRRGIPLVLCSSKTAAEIVPLRSELNFEHCPAIVENGAGILAAGSDNVTPQPLHGHLLGKLRALPDSLRADFSGFSDWSCEFLMEQTGLDEQAVKLARRRDFTEPGRWRGDAAGYRQFVSALAEQGISIQQGGRFITLGFGASKAIRMAEILREYNREGPLRSIALGDAPNDIEMLQQADIGIIIPNPAHDGISRLDGESDGRIIRAASPGAAGWNDALLAVID